MTSAKRASSPKTEKQKLAAWLVKSGGNKGAIFTRKTADNPPIQVVGEALNKAARRKIN